MNLEFPDVRAPLDGNKKAERKDEMPMSNAVGSHFFGIGDKVVGLLKLKRAWSCWGQCVGRVILRWKGGRFEVRQVDSMRDLKFNSCRSHKNYFEGDLPFRGEW